MGRKTQPTLMSWIIVKIKKNLKAPESSLDLIAMYLESRKLSHILSGANDHGLQELLK